jgi:hypothetical protein
MADMGEAEFLQREIQHRRADLSATMTELRHVASETLDPRNIARNAAYSGLERASRAIQRASSAAAERPLLAGAAAAFIGLVIVAVTVSRRRRLQPPNWRERLVLVQQALSS